MILQNTYNVGIYCRLSREDSNGNQESMSIAHQRQLLTDYVKKEGWVLRDTYIDDGVSGATFERADFKRMIADTELGKIDCVVTKDLSRLGRDYSQSGYYTDSYFPEKGIRFIAINDNVDTARDTNDMIAFQHVINGIYPQQVSKKVKQVKRKGADNGKFMNSKSPYGYCKCATNKHKLIVDEYAASIVRRIFRESYNGASARAIGEKLTQESIDSPRFYAYKHGYGQQPKPSEVNAWSSSTVCQILKRQAYVGDMVQHTREVISHKTKKRRAVPREDWIIVPDTHEVIIERDVWDEIQRRFTEKSRPRKSVSKGKDAFALFSGCLVCADCNSKLAYQSSPQSGAYRCSRYNNGGKTVCTTHYILEETLAELVLNDIQQYAKLAADDRQSLEADLLDTLLEEQNVELRQIKRQKTSLENRHQEIVLDLKCLYDDRRKGTLTEGLFRSLADDYAREQSDLSEQLKALNERVMLGEDAQIKATRFLERVQNCFEIQTLTREVVMALIDSITVGEKITDGERQTQPIQIRYKFIGNAHTNAKEDIA